MKLLMSWTISFLLSVQPAMVWAGTKTVSHRSEINNEIKNYLNKTGLTRKSMSVQEFYNNNKDLFDDAERASLEKMVKENGNVQIPKMDVTTVKNKAGEEVYQLQAVADGQSTSITLFGDQEEFVRVNGVGISVKEGLSVEKTMAKLGTPKEAMDYYFRGPASVDGNGKKSKSRKPSNAGKLLSAEQVMKMNLEQKQKYFKQLRQLMESVESVQNAFNESPRGASLQNDFFQYVAGLMLGDQALADEGGNAADSETATPGNTCVIAGNISEQGVRKKGAKWQTCGRDSNGVVFPAIQGNCKNKNQIQCNPALYGNGNFCVTPGKTSTADCNNLAKNPINFENADEYTKFKTQADGVIKQAKDTCGDKLDGKDGDVSKIIINNMRDDQVKACSHLKARAAKIESLCTGEPKPKYCETPAATATADQPTPVAGTTGNPVGNSGNMSKCSELINKKGHIINGSADICDQKDSSMNPEDKECVADDNIHLGTVKMCVCAPSFKEDPDSVKFKCVSDKSNTASTGSVDNKQKKGFWSKTKGVFSSIGNWFGDHKKFFLNLGIGLAVTGLVYKIAKKSTKAYYNNLDPVAPVAPITVPTVPPAREGAY